MDTKVNTFKELIRLFIDFKNCKIVPVLNESNFVKGYYLKKNVIANASSSTFLTRQINSDSGDVIEAASSENEGGFLEQLGELDNFPVIFPDGSYKVVSFTDFITDHVPLKYDSPIEETENNSYSLSKNEDIEAVENNIEDKIFPDNDLSFTTQSKDLDAKINKKKHEDLFAKNTDKVKPFFEEFDFNGTFDLVAYLEGIEKRVIEKYLKYYDYNITHTADALKIPRQTLQYKIKKYEL